MMLQIHQSVQNLKKNSRMLIINPPEETNYFYNNCSYCKPEIYILNEITKKFEKKEPYKK